MRIILAALGLVVLATAPIAADETTRFPYSAFAASDATPVRSGPAETFYPVLNLKAGDAVEVWRHDADGWCAIRPPEGSFSWVAADFVETKDGRVGTIVGNEVNVRIGTQFSSLRDAIAIRLDEGETVDLFKTGMIEGTPDRQWLKIYPPSGEFRWVHEKQLVHDPKLLSVQTVAAAETTPPAKIDTVPVDTLPLDTARLDALRHDAPVESVLNEMEIMLSRMVAVEPTAWHFADLHARADALVERSTTAIERSKARQFLGKLERFEDIRKRYTTVAQIRTDTSTVDRQLATAPIATQKTTLDGIADASRYDGVGRLTRLVTKPDAPASYALTDEAGEIKAYVTAAPGVNLRQYTGLDVGINGIKGFVTDERKEQLTAKRVDVLTARSAAAAYTR